MILHRQQRGDFGPMLLGGYVGERLTVISGCLIASHLLEALKSALPALPMQACLLRHAGDEVLAVNQGGFPPALPSSVRN